MMSVEEQNPDFESDESEAEAEEEEEQDPDPEDNQDDLRNLFNNLTLFHDIYTNNEIIDLHQAAESAERQMAYDLVSGVLEYFLENPSQEEEMSSASEDEDLLRTFQDLSGLLADLSSVLSPTEENGEAEASEEEPNDLQEGENQT